MKKEITKESNKIVLFFTGMLAISCLIIFASYIFGDNLFIFRDCGGDTQDQYYPYYVSVEPL